MQRRGRVVGLSFAACAGLASAIALTLPASAKAWNIGSPPPGFTVTSTVGCNGPDYTIWGGPWGSQDLGSMDPNCNGGSYTAFQSRLDYYIDSNCPYVVECYTAYPQYAPTTQTTTTTTAASTTTTATTTAPTDTTPAAAPAPPITTCDLQCQVDTLSAQVAALKQQFAQLVLILEEWPGIDPGILAQLMSLTTV